MSGADWQPGDLALCVKNGSRPGNPTRRGCVYRVKRVWINPVSDSLALDFAGVFNGARCRSKATFWGHNPARFRKITPGAEIIGKEAEKRIPVPHLFPETV